MKLHKKASKNNNRHKNITQMGKNNKKDNQVIFKRGHISFSFYHIQCFGYENTKQFIQKYYYMGICGMLTKFPMIGYFKSSILWEKQK